LTTTRILHAATVLLASWTTVGSAKLEATTATAADAPTYSSHVATILNQRCVSCHRPGQIGPMSLRSYDEVRPWVKSIARRVADGTMPPWHATGGTAKFVNDRSLEQSAIDTLVSWAQTGAPAGDLATAPPPPEYPEGEWQLGEPDFVVTLDPVELPAGGPDHFPKIVGKVALPDDKWITAVEILPGNAKVVHHVIAVAVKGFDIDPVDGWLGAWAAGTEPMVFPEGTGRFLEKGSNIIADMHYHPADTPQSDVTRIGLHFADGTIEKELTNIWVDNESFEIPPGAKDYELRAQHRFWQDGKILAFAPHMHYRGKDFRYVAHWPDGSQETLLEVARWDFNWQTWYRLAEPIPVPAGTVLEAIAHYDNSADNPANPDPTQAVRFGNETKDEMMIGFVDFVAAEGVRPMTPHETRTRELERLAAARPGKVFAVSAKPVEKRSEPHSFAPLVLEAGASEGVFYVIWGNQLEPSRVYDLLWDGTAFAGKVDSPRGAFDFTGTVEGGKASATLHLPQGRLVTFDGELAGP
jgi:mono/diheme cytochrome c family protein